MFIEQSELFKGLSQGALEAIRKEGAEKSYGPSDQVFREDDHAADFYVLAEGNVRLVMGDAEELCFVVDNAGEVFGWSALVEPYRYRATARCAGPSRLVVLPRRAVEEVERNYPRDGLVIFKNLAAIVTEKLREAYQEQVSEADLEGANSSNEGFQRLT